MRKSTAAQRSRSAASSRQPAGAVSHTLYPLQTQLPAAAAGPVDGPLAPAGWRGLGSSAPLALIGFQDFSSSAAAATAPVAWAYSQWACSSFVVTVVAQQDMKSANGSRKKSVAPMRAAIATAGLRRCKIDQL